MLVRIKPDQARLGMYVKSFEAGWLSHPFWRTQFVIASNDDLTRVREVGADIFIDTTLGTGVKPSGGNKTSGEIAPSISPKSTIEPALPGERAVVKAKRMPRRAFSPPAFGKADKTRAAVLAQRSSQVVKSLFEDSRLGRPVATPEILTVVRDIADALEQSSAAFVSITRLKAKDDYTYTHSVAVCALMIMLARETDASPAAVRDLGVAGLLHDIGKLSIDEAILQKVGPLDEQERQQIALHPELGHAVLVREANLPLVALDVCLHHHERIDGSGYPFGLQNDGVTTAARMATICDVYDAMTSNRPYKKGKSPLDAITEMEETVGGLDRSLLFKFMRSVGVFPAGKLIRLRSNRLAVAIPTVSANCYPVARAFYNTVDSCLTDYEDVVLGNSFADDQAVSQEDPRRWFAADWSSMRASLVAGIPMRKS